MFEAALNIQWKELRQDLLVILTLATVGVLLRKMIELESQGAGLFFGEPEFDVKVWQ